MLVQLTHQIVEWRNPKLIDHSIKEMVTQRVLQIAAGYEDADDCDVLRNDSMMKLASGRLPSDDALCSQPTMTRLENHVQHKELYDMGWVFVKHFVKSYDKEPKRIILDLDDSNSNCYGSQQLSVFNGYYGEQLATATIITLRKRIILQPARITELKTKIKIEFQRDNPMRDEIPQALPKGSGGESRRRPELNNCGHSLIYFFWGQKKATKPQGQQGQNSGRAAGSARAK